MAPEIVRGEALPSTATDLYSLSVLLFYLLMVSHPLEGLRMARADVFGREEALVHYATTEGISARALSLTGFGEEEGE